jgi:hypothetical protein
MFLIIGANYSGNIPALTGMPARRLPRVGPAERTSVLNAKKLQKFHPLEIQKYLKAIIGVTF